MNAMILAAGLGTRLKPWTETHPKALVPVGGVPMLARVLDKMRAEGFDRVVVNIHHFAGQIRDFLADYDAGMEVLISDESQRLLDTGGGLCHAVPLFADGPVLVHNVDILSNAGLRALVEYHEASGNDVTLLTSGRSSSRRLAFDADGRLCGWRNLKSGETRPATYRAGRRDVSEEAFSGIYAVSPRVFGFLEDYRTHAASGDAFPIMDFFLSMSEGLRIGRRFEEDLRLIDIGKPETLDEARQLYTL